MKQQCTIWIQNEVSVVVLGVNPNHLSSLYDKFGIHVPGYQYQPKFKLGIWDGQTHYFSKTGKTYFNIIEEVVKSLINYGYDVKIKDDRVVYDTPDYVDSSIFEHLLHPDTGEPIVLHDYQVTGVNSLIEHGHGVCLASTSSGKAQSLTSKVMTPSGWKLMGDIAVGDQVTTPSGRVSSVVAVFPQGKLPLYRVTFEDESSTLCCDDHLWTVRMPDTWSSTKTSKVTVPLRTMREFLEKSHLTQRTDGSIYVPLVEPIEWTNPPPCKIPSYLLGVLLSKGRFLPSNAISMVLTDDYVVDKVRNLAQSIGYSLTHSYGRNFIITGCDDLNIIQTLKEYDLVGKKSLNKFIPEEYKKTSVEERFELLRGLLDTAGTLYNQHSVVYVTSSRQITKDIQEIAWSLGAVCSVAPQIRHRGTQRWGDKSFNVIIAMHDQSLLFSLPRKKNRCIRPRIKVNQVFGRQVSSIVLETVDDAQCIMIDDAEQLYITDDYIVTHNTFMCAALVTAHDRKQHTTITIVPDQTLIGQTKRDYILCGLDVGEYSGNEKSLNHKHVVSTWQALQHNPGVVKSFQAVIVDECLDGDTLITMENGATKAIKNVVAGDRVLTFNERSSCFEPDTVVKRHENLMVSSNEDMYEMVFDNGTTLKVTGNHKVLTTSGLVRADELRDSHDVVTTNLLGRVCTLVKIDKPTTTYNLHVEHNHNYVANGVVVSNCHGLRGTVIRDIVTNQAQDIPFRYGFTGTLPKHPSEAMAVKIAVGPVRFEIAAHTLQERGILSTVSINVLQTVTDLTKEYNKYCDEEVVSDVLPSYDTFKEQYLPDHKAESVFLQELDSRTEWLAKHIIERSSAKLGNCLVLVSNKAIGSALQKLIPDSIFVHGTSTKKASDRKQIYDMFATHNNLVVIATVHIAGTGLSIRRIYNLYTVDIGKSFTRVIQAIGRGLRTSKDKNHVDMWDICADLKYSKDHLRDRISFYKEAKYPHKKKKIEC